MSNDAETSFSTLSIIKYFNHPSQGKDCLFVLSIKMILLHYCNLKNDQIVCSQKHGKSTLEMCLILINKNVVLFTWIL